MKRRHFVILSSFCGIGLVGFGTSAKTLAPFETENLSSTQTPDLIVETPTTEPLLRFIAVADTGTGEPGQYAVAEAMTRYHQKSPFNLAILAGDNIYPNGKIEKIQDVFEKPYQSLLQQGVKFQAVLGNHDIRTQNGDLQLNYPNFNMKGRYYTFRQDSIQFFALDTNHNADWNKQLKWLDQELSQSDAAWKIVFGHHQIYASGVYGENPALIKKLTPLFQKYGVQLYINGHEHHYERTRSINGTTYLICGAGAKNRGVKRSDWTEYSTDNLSFAAFDVYENQIIISGINTQNQIFDQGVILQS